jgi:hydroxymethylbilane synthase
MKSSDTTVQKIVIGTRGSDLALKQTDIVSRAITTADPSVKIEVRIITTTGDTNQNPIPTTAKGKGWFTKEIEEELLAGTIDLAVHSLKDVGEKQPKGLMLAAYLPREDARDALITKNGESLENLRKGAVVGTDSPRRQAQMLALRPDLNMKSLRGNVPTRLQKLDGTFVPKNNVKGDTDGKAAPAEKYDAIILAVAGLKRLGLEKRIIRTFEPNEMTPAPGQGIMTVQTRSDDEAVRKILALINDADATLMATIERSFSRTTGGGCKSPTGAYAFRDGSECVLVGMIAEEDGSKVIRGEMRVTWGSSEADSLGETLAKKLLAQRGTK